MLFGRKSLSNLKVYMQSDDTFQKYALKSQIYAFHIRNIFKFLLM